MPPNSLVEWVAGRNFPTGPQKLASRGVFKVELVTDDETDADTIAVTYPRTRKSRTGYPKSDVARVRFDTTTQEPSPRRKTSSSGRRHGISEKASSEDSSTDSHSSGSSFESLEKDAHSTKKSRDRSVNGKPKDQATMASRETKRPKARQPESKDDKHLDRNPRAREHKQRRKGTRTREGKKEKSSKDNTDRGDDGAGEDTEGDQAEEESEEEPEGKPAQKVDGKEADWAGGEAIAGQKTSREAVVKDGNEGSNHQPNPLPDLRRPNLIMPIRSQVLQLEDVVETAEDPRPNAFLDREHGICRVYHGPVYGNPHGSLCSYRTWSVPLPAGVPHPTNNPYPPCPCQQRQNGQTSTGAQAVPTQPPIQDMQRASPPRAAERADTRTREGSQPKVGFSGLPEVSLFSPGAIAARFDAHPPPDGHSTQHRSKDDGWHTNIDPRPASPPAGAPRARRRHRESGYGLAGGHYDAIPTDGGAADRAWATLRRSQGDGDGGRAGDAAVWGAPRPPRDIGGSGWGEDLGGWGDHGTKTDNDNWGAAAGGSDHRSRDFRRGSRRSNSPGIGGGGAADPGGRARQRPTNRIPGAWKSSPDSEDDPTPSNNAAPTRRVVSPARGHRHGGGGPWSDGGGGAGGLASPPAWGDASAAQADAQW